MDLLAVTPALRAAWADPAVAVARRCDLLSIAIPVVLAVVTPSKVPR